MLTTILASESHLPDINRSAGEFVSMVVWGKPGKVKDFCSVSVLDDEHPIAAIVMRNWDQDRGVVEIVAAGSGRWQSRRVINLVFWTCFDAMQCQAVLMRISETNLVSVKNAKRLGFLGHFIPRLCGRDEGEWIFVLTEEAWRASRLYKPPTAG